MASQIRLVRCPRCLQLLKELPEVPLYRCGGCGAVLQAKNRTKHSELSSQVTDFVRQDNGSQENVARSSNLDSSGLAEGEPLTDKEDNSSHQDECGDARMELSEDTRVSKGLSTSPEVSCHETEDSRVEDNKPLKREESEWCHQPPLSQNFKSCGDSSRDCNGKWTEGEILSDDQSPCSSEYIYHEAQECAREATEPVEQHNLDRCCNGGEFSRARQEGDDRVDRAPNLPANEDLENDLRSGGGAESSSPGIVSHDNGDDASQSAKSSSGADDSTDGLSTFQRSGTESSLNASVEDSIVDIQTTVKGSTESITLKCPDDEHLDYAVRKASQTFGSGSSVEGLESSCLAEPISDLYVEHGDMTVCPTNRSYNPYDGTESSYGNGQIPKHIPHPLWRKGMDANNISTTAMPKGSGRHGVNDMLDSEPEMNCWTPSSSVLREQQHRAMKGVPRKHRTSGNDMRWDKEDDGSQLPLTHRSGGPSFHEHNMLPLRPACYLSPDGRPFSELDKMELLRTVCELKDQPKRIQFLKAAANGRFPCGVMEEKRASSCCDNLTPEMELYSDLNHIPGYQPNSGANISRVAFPADCRHQVNCSCLHGLEHLLPLCRHGCCLVNNGHLHCNISTFSSPHHHSGSAVSAPASETQPDRDREMKRLLREKYHSASKYLRPMAGGAPVVPCNCCSELLQLPADFLIFRRTYHQLRCGACGNVLRFVLLERKRLVPYLPAASARAQPSESCNDDCGRSLDRTEGEDSNDTHSFDLIERKAYNRRPTSSGMKSISDESEKKNKGSAGTSESVGASSMAPSQLEKGSSEIEKPTDHALHRLMGYSSASQVLCRWSD